MWFRNKSDVIYETNSLKSDAWDQTETSKTSSEWSRPIHNFLSLGKIKQVIFQVIFSSIILVRLVVSFIFIRFNFVLGIFPPSLFSELKAYSATAFLKIIKVCIKVLNILCKPVVGVPKPKDLSHLLVRISDSHRALALSRTNWAANTIWAEASLLFLTIQILAVLLSSIHRVINFKRCVVYQCLFPTNPRF